MNFDPLGLENKFGPFWNILFDGFTLNIIRSDAMSCELYNGVFDICQVLRSRCFRGRGEQQVLYLYLSLSYNLVQRMLKFISKLLLVSVLKGNYVFIAWNFFLLQPLTSYLMFYWFLLKRTKLLPITKK